MAQNREKGGKVVFIGNIPYGVSEEQICDIFGHCGTVVNFRLVYDKETGRPKGFGFLEYTDPDMAASAVRNLNDSELMGRTLRVDYSNDNSGGKQKDDHGANAPAASAPQFGGMPGMPGPPPNGANPAALPPLPQGADLPPNVTAPDAVSKTLSALGPAELLDIISQMKNLAVTEPQKAEALLSMAPQLSFAIFQAMLLMDLVDTSTVGQLVQQAAGQLQQPPPPPQQQQQPPPQPQQQQQPPPQMYPQPQVYQQPPPMYQAPPTGPPQYGYHAATPPVQQAPYQPPPSQQQQQQAQVQAQLAALPPDHRAAIQNVLNLSIDQINQIQNEQQRATIMQLRQQYGGVA